MGFRSEVRGFISEQNSKDTTIKILIDELAVLREQNSGLMDRLMATNFQELKVYSDNDGSQINMVVGEESIIDADYQDAGEIV